MARHQPVLHVGVARDEAFDGRRVRGVPHERRAVGRIRVGAGEDELPARVRLTGELQVLLAELPTPLEVVGNDVVEKEEPLHRGQTTRTVVLLKLTLTPAIVVVASLLGRRFGPSFAGWLVGFPFTSAPVSVFLTLEQGTAFAATSAVGSIESAAADVGFCLVYMWTARRGWPIALLAASAAYVAGAVVLATTIHDPLVAAVITLALLLVAPRFATVAPDRAAQVRPLPRWDLPVRAIVATTLVVAITTLAPIVGPTASGIISGIPLYATVLAVFAHQHAGPASGAAVMRGLLAGLYGFATFFVVIAVAIVPVGPLPAFILAFIAVVAVQSASLASLRR